MSAHIDREDIHIRSGEIDQIDYDIESIKDDK